MSLIKYVDRMKRMDQLIRMKATGTPDDFSEKMGICKSMLLNHIKELRLMGAPIRYCADRQSYCYDKDCKLIIDFKQDGEKLKGGKSYFFKKIYQSNNIRLKQSLFGVC